MDETQIIKPQSDFGLSKTFSYGGSIVRMKKVNGTVFVCLTDMARSFPNKTLSHIINSKEMTEYVNRIAEMQNCTSADLLQVTKGGNAEQGTWAHRKIALRVAQKLSPDFAIWVDDRIEELLTYGMTATEPTLDEMVDNPDLVIKLATKLKNVRAEKARLEVENANKAERIKLQDEQLKVQAPKVQYVDEVLQSVNTYTSTQMRKEVGLKDADRLHKALKERNIMFKQSGQWMLVAKYSGKGYTKPRTYTFTRSDGSTGTNTITTWTERGRAFLHKTFNIVKAETNNQSIEL